MRRIANVAPWPNVDLYDSSEQVAWANRCHNTLNEFDGVGLRSHVNQRLGLIQARVSDDVQRDEYWQAVDNVTWLKTPCQGKYVVGVFADGGVSYVNPSPYGGAWTFCHVDQHDHRVLQGAGVFAPWEEATPDMPALGAMGRDKRSKRQLCITNNQMEYYALLMAMEALPNGWSGYAYTDSQITIGRFFWGWHVDHNIPAAWSARVGRAITRLGKVTPVLLSGHPTLNDLRARVKVKTGRMVSLHNVWCDAQCSRLGAQMPPDVVRKARLPQEA
jgi:ribonuclease HI